MSAMGQSYANSAGETETPNVKVTGAPPTDASKGDAE